MFRNLDFLGRALSLSWGKNASIASNIANVDTPNYKRIYSDFHTVLQNELQVGSGIQMRLTDKKHFKVPTIFHDGMREISSTSYRVDGNNVDIDVENAELAKNQLYYHTVTNELNSQLSRLKTAMRVNK